MATSVTGPEKLATEQYRRGITTACAPVAKENTFWSIEIDATDETAPPKSTRCWYATPTRADEREHDRTVMLATPLTAPLKVMPAAAVSVRPVSEICVAGSAIEPSNTIEPTVKPDACTTQPLMDARM